MPVKMWMCACGHKQSEHMSDERHCGGSFNCLCTGFRSIGHSTPAAPASVGADTTPVIAPSVASAEEKPKHRYETWEQAVAVLGWQGNAHTTAIDEIRDRLAVLESTPTAKPTCDCKDFSECYGGASDGECRQFNPRCPRCQKRLKLDEEPSPHSCTSALAPASRATPEINRKVYLSHQDAANAGHEWDMVRQTTAYTCYGCRICEVKP